MPELFNTFLLFSFDISRVAKSSKCFFFFLKNLLTYKPFFTILRFLAILKPFSVRRSSRRIKVMLLTAWGLAVLLSLPQTVVFHVEKHPQFQWYQAKLPTISCMRRIPSLERGAEVSFGVACCTLAPYWMGVAFAGACWGFGGGVCWN